MSNRDLFEEFNTALAEAKDHSEGKVTLRSHKGSLSEGLEITPVEIRDIREDLNLSRGVFAQLLRTSLRTLENWEQGRSSPNDQAVTLLKLVQRHPETLSYIAAL